MFNEKAILAQLLTGSGIPAIAGGGLFALRFYANQKSRFTGSMSYNQAER